MGKESLDFQASECQTDLGFPDYGVWLGQGCLGTKSKEDAGCGESTSKGIVFFCVCMSVCIYYVNMNLSEYAFHESMSVMCYMSTCVNVLCNHTLYVNVV